MSKLNRRSFLRKSAAASALTGLFYNLPSKVWSSEIPPSDQINAALIGCNKKGFEILKNHLDFKGVNCVAMCDIDRNILEERASEIKKNYGFNPVLYSDFRKMLEQKDIDVVIVGTPDHWHCLNTVYSLEAGKDVYLEKPMANSIQECNIITNATKYYNRIVQVGQQQRSNHIFIQTMNLIKSGTIGALRKVNIWANFYYGLGPTPAKDSPVPMGVDYDMWLGPAAERPFNINHFHGKWRHFWSFGGGMFSDWGVHLIDMALWLRDTQSGPGQVLTCATNNSAIEAKRETFDTMNVIYPLDEFMINFDMTAGVERGPYENKYGISFIGDKATIKANRRGFVIIPEKDRNTGEDLTDPLSDNSGKDAHSNHVGNFLECVRSGETPVCPPEIGRAAAIHAHTANISGRIGEPLLIWDDKLNKFTNSNKANEYIIPEYRAPWTLPDIPNS
jgi:predicted dehydrogenase